MRRLPVYLLALAATACADSPAEITGPASTSEARLARAVAPEQQASVFRPGVVVARFVNDAQGLQTAALHGATPLRTMRLGAHVLRVPEGREQAVVQALNASPGVVYAELSVARTLGLPCTVGDGDCQPPTDPLFGHRWDLNNDGAIRDPSGNIIWSTGLVPDADSDWLEAFDQLGFFTGSARLGIVDTGIFGGHADLAGRLVAQYDFFNVDGIAEDDNGHGTHVSGIGLANGDNGTGTPGIAYGPNIELVVAKGCGYVFLIGYICWSDDIADGIAWAVDSGANVINLSLGGDSGAQVEQDALQYAVANDVLPVCAAGNDQADVDYPGAYPECMAVSATDWADHLSSYSSFGLQVEVAAPGGDTILSNGYDRILSTWNNGGYVFAAGTSMASPHVAGLAALLHALGVTSADEKRQIIRATADDLGAAGFDVQFGDGRVNIWNAVLAALGEPPPPPPPNTPPLAAFTASCTDNVCDFTDTSTDSDGLVTQWSWDFGDGATSSAVSPSHAYVAGGNYTVSLTVTDNRGATDTAQQTVAVTDPPPPPPNQPPTAAFTTSCADNRCDFTDTSTDSDGTVTQWSWDFGDGQVSSTRNPSHAYDAEGDYTVTLTVTDDDGDSDSARQTVTAGPPPAGQPTADFTYSCTENVCSFSDASTDPDDNLTQWSWDFGDNSFATSQNPSHTYAAGGDYTVTLGITDSQGLTDVVSKVVTVGDPPPPPANNPPTASFTWSCNGQLCTFTDTSTDPEGNITQWSWSFGDNSFAASQSPSHFYAAEGEYTVTLGVTDVGGLSDAVQQTITVGPPPPNEGPTASFTYVCTDNACDFTDTSTDGDGSVTQWSWDFGDGGVSTAQSPSHVYSAAGDYTVTLTVTDDGGLTDSTQQVVTAGPPPAGQPTADFTYGCADNVCSFSDASTDTDGTVTQWSWSFGDNSFATSQNPSHTYAAGGDYTVTLGITDNDGLTDMISKTVTVGEPPPPPPNNAPTASFTWSCDGQLCTFSDTSTDPENNINQWSWDFGDNSFATSQSASHWYASPGEYRVTLGITDAGGLTDVAQQTITVGAPPPPPNDAPTAGFAYACTDNACDFTDASTDVDGTVTQWSWDFGDGVASSAQSPSHTFAVAGDYTVTLTVTDDGGLTDTTQQTITVTLPPTQSLVLTATGSKVQGRNVVDLAWTTGISVAVDVMRNGATISTVPAGTLSYQDATGDRGKATYTYMVCEAGGGVCSNEVTVSF